MFVAEGLYRYEKSVPVFFLIQHILQPVLQICGLQTRSVDDEIRIFAYRIHQFSLPADGFRIGTSVSRQRMDPSRLLETADQRLIGGFQKENLHFRSGILQFLQHSDQIAEKLPPPDVHDESRSVHIDAVLLFQRDKGL